MSTKNIAVLAGDGIGPEITNIAVDVLKAVAQKYNHEFNFIQADIGAAAIDKHKEPFPTQTEKICREADAILFGAIGDPKYDNDPGAKVRPEQGLLKMRQNLGLFANIRPVKIYPELIDRSPLKPDIIKNVDFIVVRELTGGIYFGQPRGLSEDKKTAFDSCVYTEYEIKRVAKIAFNIALSRNKKLTLVDKANVLATSRLWRKVVQAMEKDYPEVKVEYMFVDNAAMQLIQNPDNFDVILTENMFGDILTDEASVLSGSLGLQPSASIGEKTSVYEPIHGSFPQGAGKNIANPIGTVLSAALLLSDSFEMHKEANEIEKAVNSAIQKGILTPDLKPENSCSSSELGSYLCKYISETKIHKSHCL